MTRASTSRAARGERALEHFRAEFARSEVARASDPAWVVTLRRRAFAHLGEIGFPTVRDEEWRFTNVAPVLETPFVSGAGPNESQAPRRIPPFAFHHAAGVQLVFVNGYFVPALSTGPDAVPGVRAESLAAALAQRPDALGFHLGRVAAFEGHGFRALNTAFLCDGAVIEIAANAVLAEPIHLLFLASAPDGATVSHPRVLIMAGEDSQARIVETYAGLDTGPYLANAVTEVVVGDGAVIDHCRVEQDGDQAFHLGATDAIVHRSASYTSHVVTFGASLSRSEIAVTLAGEGATCTLDGLYIAGGARLVDHHTEIDHARPHCTSHELYKGVLAGRARAVFNGRIRVRPDAQKTDAKQTNRTLLLSDEAQINTKPQLQIFANDVKCTHGATVGQLSEDALFYLRSRGIGGDEARALLIHAFSREILDRMPLEPLRRHLDALLVAELRTMAGDGRTA